MLWIYVCLYNTYLCFRKTFYCQSFGIAIIFSYFRYCNLVMECIQSKMLNDFVSPPRIWLRYIDDTFFVLKKTDVASFHKSINNI